MKILVVQQKMIGDVLISSMICENLKKEYPDAQVDYLVNSFTTPVIQNNPYIDNVILFEDKFRANYISFFKFLLQIRRKKYDIVIDPYAKLESSLITLFSGAPKRIGYQNKGLGIAYNQKEKHHSKPKSYYGLAIERRINLFEKLIKKNTIDPFPKLHLLNSEKEEMIPVFKQYGIDLASEKVIMISILGSEVSKTYPEDYMVKLIDFVAENYAVKILFNYTPKQQKEAHSIYNKCNEKTKQRIVLDLIGSDLRSFIKIMYHCSLIIGNDGGAVNIAKALKKPSFTIFSPWIKKENWSIFEDGTTHIGVHLFDFYPELKKQFELKKLKEEYSNFYLKLKPELFSDKLNTFLNQNLKS
ncbi:glycosyltransferase family 9 protein [Flavobacterium sasangense]|uniref:glycosyltransferase family 9 protein n=1 Tax=Flavobacterium sasangense TaxID=503361 RepID=UPI000478DDF5|nr:glycosyltransferase family 9 protein [Flavobacterium sasangense]